MSVQVFDNMMVFFFFSGRTEHNNTSVDERQTSLIQTQSCNAHYGKSHRGLYPGSAANRNVGNSTYTRRAGTVNSVSSDVATIGQFD